MKTITSLFSIAAMLGSVQLVSAQAPTVAAPTPTYPAEDVISIYSVTYDSPLTEFKFQDNWYTKGETTTSTDVEIGDDAALKITDLQWASYNMKPEIKFRGYDYVHVDVYSNEETEFCIGFQNWVPGEEVYSSFVKVEAGKWNSYDFDLADIYLTNDGRNANVLRINHDEPDGTQFAKEIYVSNIYVYKGEPQQGSVNTVADDSSVNVFPTAVTSTVNIQSPIPVKGISVYSVSGALTGKYTGNSIDLSNLEKGVYILSIEQADGQAINKRILKL